MKKILFAAVALVAMASCATDDVVSRPADEAIDFAEAFVENSTRANDINKDNLSQFNVYGSVNVNGTNGFIFEDQSVTKSGDAYTYSPAQYWIPAAAYKFTAFASLTSDQAATRQWSFTKGADAANGTISFNNKDAQANQDLVYAYAVRNTPESIDSKPAAVAFTFNHMLSRVKFTIANGFTAGSNIKLDITNLTITDAHADGTLAIEDGEAKTWAVGTETFSRNFGSTTQLADNNATWTTEHFYLIPTKATYNVTFDVTLWQADVPVDTYSRTATVTLDMEKGMSYNIKAALNASNTAEDGSEIYPIEFTVTDVENWENFGDVDATIPEHTAANATELAAAVAEGGAIVLTDDIDLDVVTRATKYGLYIDKDCVIDGAGHTITCDSGYDVRAIAVSGAKNVVLKNFTLNATGERGIQVQGGAKNVTIENVTATAANYTVNLPSSAGATNVVINNCDLKGLNTINVAAPGAVVTVNNSTLRTEDNASTEGYATIAINKDGIGANVTVNGGEVVITGSYATDTEAGSVGAEGANIVFNGTKCGEGEPTIKDRYFAIVYPDGNYYAFSTLADAVAKAEEGETIILTKDATVAAETKIYKNVNIDLNGFTLTAAALDPIENYGKMILSNGKIVAGNAEGTRRCIYNYGEMTINGVEFVQTYGAKGAAINNEGKMVIENATVNSVYYAIWNSGANTELTINGGVYNCVGDKSTWLDTDGNAIDSVAWCYAVRSMNGAKMTINGGTFTGNHGVVSAYDANTNVVINGGTFECYATLTGNSDWVFFTDSKAAICYDAKCAVKTANTVGATYGNVTTK